MVVSSTVFKCSLVFGCTLFLLPSSQGAWRNLVSSWTDSGGQWTGSTPTSDSVFHFGPVRVWTPAINSANYEITSRVYSTTGIICGHMFKYKTGSTRTQSLVTKAWGYYLINGNSVRVSSTGIEYSPIVSYSYPTNQWNNLRSVVLGTQVTIYINDKLVKQVNMQGTGADSSSDNYVGLWCHSNTNERGRDFSVQKLPDCPKLPAINHLTVSPSKCETSSSSFGTTCSFRCSRGFKLNGPSNKTCASGGKWTEAGASVRCTDVNECLAYNGGCSHVCINTAGGYRCSCSDPDLRLTNDNHTCEVPDTRVTCGPSHIQISIPKARLPGVVVQDLHLLDPSCRATEDSTHFYLKTLFNQCGTVTNKTSSSITYANKVIERPLPKNVTITRIRELEVSFTCSYSRKKELITSQFQPHKSKLIFNKNVRGNFSFSFRFYPNSSFHTPYAGNFTVPLRLRQPMFFEVSVESENRELDVLAQDCYATPFNSVTRPRHWLIKDGCLVDSTLKDLNTSSPSVQRFSFQAFRFVGNYRHLFFHCHVTACDGNDVKSVCARGCAKGKPVKRKEKSQRRRLMQGLQLQAVE
ncbi:oncoprotein-induced transcript 3 protein-like isoform X2 [Actinia tenebrosa]|uniref:Oncoprotein-induced transcript 3 protein-like isoform X2 n=1 Tax=Actinia tenebrosa TaxID=6105 RepID=A0A6P8HGY1_ACTTE|nr:oncoprotein-induced transcript 3 protein-like isoform X2 [Actinia tenebrosa]